MNRVALAVGGLLLLSTGALAEDKGQYHLFHPVPQELMREMSTDRPDKTESAYTVDAGHFQIETSLLDYTYNHRNSEDSDIRTDSWGIVPVNLKAGLLNNVDLQVVMNPYLTERSAGNDEKSEKDGFGDVQTRLKMNLWGNDGGTTALAVMPFVKFPTNSGQMGNQSYESGIIVPLAVALPYDWSMGLMSEFDFNRDEDKNTYTEFINSITFSHNIVGALSGYMEFFSSFNKKEPAQWVGTVDCGLTYGINDHVQLDAGVNIGVTRSADDVNPFLGLSVRY